MKNKLLLRISFSALIILFSGLLSQSKSQVKEKKSNPDIFFPNRKKTQPVIVKTQPVIVTRSQPVIVRNGNNLPPGQEKKIYGEKSAKRFAPGQRKKAYGSNWQYNKNRKHLNKKWEHDNKNKKHHGHDD